MVPPAGIEPAHAGLEDPVPSIGGGVETYASVELALGGVAVRCAPGAVRHHSRRALYTRTP